MLAAASALPSELLTEHRRSAPVAHTVNKLVPGAAVHALRGGAYELLDEVVSECRLTRGSITHLDRVPVRIDLTHVHGRRKDTRGGRRER